MLERVIGIEPTSSAWKAEVLPLNYTRFMPYPLGQDVVRSSPFISRNRSNYMVEGVGFEPTKA